MVRFENVGLRYGLGPEVLQDISYELAQGSFHFLVGPSGAGKSSLLRLMYLALKPSRGLITLFGRDIATNGRQDLAGLRRRIGVVFQDFRLLDHLTAFDNVALPLRVAGVRESEVRKHVKELLTWVGLQDHLGARPPTLSGGQQQAGSHRQGRHRQAQAAARRRAHRQCRRPDGLAVHAPVRGTQQAGNHHRHRHP